MYPAQFEYSKAGSVAEAIQILQGDPEAKIIAGGHSLIPLMKLRLARPSRVVDIGGIDGLRGISVSGGAVSIGALTTHHEISTSADVQANCGILAEAAAGVGDPAVRNRGTIGGNVSHADPASDLPTVLTALGASFTLQGPSGSRTVAADDFFVGPFETAVGANEVLTSVSVPVLAANQLAEYAKMAHPATSFAVVGAAAVVTLEGDGHGHGHDHDHDHGPRPWSRASLHLSQGRCGRAYSQADKVAGGGGSSCRARVDPPIHCRCYSPCRQRPGRRHSGRRVCLRGIPAQYGRRGVEACPVPCRRTCPPLGSDPATTERRRPHRTGQRLRFFALLEQAPTKSARPEPEDAADRVNQPSDSSGGCCSCPLK